MSTLSRCLGTVLTGVIAGALGLPAGAAAQAQETPFKEQVDVARVLIDARVVDRAGKSVTALAAEDFRVLVDGSEVRLESVEWVAATDRYGEGLAPELAATLGEPPAPPGRLIVLLFQKDFHPSRLVGLMRMKKKAAAMIADLLPDDRVAVASFDSHLKLWLDFTDDRERLREVVERSLLFEEPGEVPPAGPPSLAAHFDGQAARDAASPEEGLEVLARALAPIPGAKSLVFFGWGLGRLSWPWVVMTRHYEPARAALVQARVTVFSLDITDADYHSLEVGLEQVSHDTGGFYVKTHLFPDIAMSRLEQALEGHYVLVVEKPDLPPGRHAIEVQLTRREGAVLARPFYDS